MIKIIKSNPVVNAMAIDGVREVYDFDKKKFSMEKIVSSKLIDNIITMDLDYVWVSHEQKEIIKFKEFLIWLHDLPEEKVIYDNTNTYNFSIELNEDNEPLFIIGWELYYLMKHYDITLQFVDDLLKRIRIKRIYFSYDKDMGAVQIDYEYASGTYFWNSKCESDHVYCSYDFKYGPGTKVFISEHTLFMALGEPLAQAVYEGTIEELKRLKAFMVFLNHYPHRKMDRDDWASPFKIENKNNVIWITLGAHACALMDDFIEVYKHINDLIKYFESLTSEEMRELRANNSEGRVRALHNLRNR